MDVRNVAYAAYPDYRFDKVTDITPEDIRSMGASAIALDLDNTSVKYAFLKVETKIKEWVNSMLEAGIPVIVVSNALLLRSTVLVRQMGNVPYIPLALKPNPIALRLAARRLGVEPGEIAMIGDQLFSDVLCANRVGSVSVKVEPIGHEPVFTSYFEKKRQLESDYLAACESGLFEGRTTAAV